MARRDSLPSGNGTSLPFGGTNAWRGGLSLVGFLVITSATIAQQHIGADPQPRTAKVIRTARSISPPRENKAAAQVPAASATAPPALDGTFIGNTRPRDVTTIALPAAEIVDQVLVAVGDLVQTGQALLTLNDAEGRRAAAQLRLEADLARTRPRSSNAR